MAVYLLLFAASVQLGLRVPDGFEVTRVADHTVVNDTHCMTLTPDGRLVVSGRGYVRLLTDEGKLIGDFVGAPKDGAMGLCWDNGDLYAVGDGGLKVWRGADRSKRPETVFRCKTGGEHTSHAVLRGPDGWMYLLVGDATAITAKDIHSDTSPVKDPSSGCVLRFSPDWKRREVFAHGFRNAYGMDFGPDGELYTYDSDNERCVGLPWYEGTRFYRVEPGGHHGWNGPNRATTWRSPRYFLDVVPPVADLGRGSPTGVAVYKHASFPEKYRGGAFLCDWTFGVIHFVPLPNGMPEAFVKAVGGEGFAPTAVCVHPKTGDLLVSVGGRGTRGGVYRIRHTMGIKRIDGEEVKRLQPRPRAHRAGDARSPDRLERQRATRHLTAPPAGPSALERTTSYLMKPSADAIELVTDTKLPLAIRIDGVRLVQRWLGGPPAPSSRGTVWEGYSRNGKAPVPGAVRAGLRSAFPSGDEILDRELARTLAMIQDDAPTVVRTAASKLGAKNAAEDVHYLAVLSRLRGPIDVRPVVDSLLTLETRLNGLPDSNWAPRLTEIHTALAGRAPGLNAALLEDARFGRPEHVRFTRVKGFDRVKAAERFLARSKDGGFTWNAELVRLIGQLPAERSLPALRALWGEAGVDEAILPLLAKHAEPGDRVRLLTGLDSARLELVDQVLGGLEKLPTDRSEVIPLIRALRQVPPGKDGEDLRNRLNSRLERVADLKQPDLAGWVAWARREYPKQAAGLVDPDGVDVEAWGRRVRKIDWSKGDAGRGATVFIKASCASCHSGAAALGPDLAGVGKRFSRADLLTAIVQPSKDVSERYRTTRVVTGRGLVHQGVIVYEAVDGLILQTGPGQTVRIPGVPTKARSPRSLMPAGLLDRLTDGEIADLLANLAGR